jgi:hypothetical protein
VARLTEIEISAATQYWVFVAMVSLIFWLMFYII